MILKIVGKFAFPEAEWCEVSEEAKDLIKGLLVKEACNRLSAEAVLNHNWIQMCEREPEDEEKLERRKKALRTPGNIRRWVCILLAITLFLGSIENKEYFSRSKGSCGHLYFEGLQISKISRKRILPTLTLPPINS